MINDKSFESKRLTLHEHMFEDSFKILEKALSISPLPKIIELVECVSLVVQIYYSSIVKTLGN